MDSIYQKIKECKTMKELDAIREEVYVAMCAENNKNFVAIQKAFRKQKNRIRRGCYK